jgi:hypothetical protein
MHFGRVEVGRNTLNSQSRRRFLSNVGSGMLMAGIGSSMAMELGISTAYADDAETALTFGSLEPLVDLMQQTPVEKLQPALLQEIKRGTELKTLIAAGALANSRFFAGQDYVGFHTMMALMPAWQISEELSGPEQALPVLKVLYRNTGRIQEAGGDEKLHKIKPATLSSTRHGGAQLMKEMCSLNMQSAESTFAALLKKDRMQAYNSLQQIVQDAPDVHRVTLSWRAWDALNLVGFEHANTLLRQSVRYCVEREKGRIEHKQPEPPLRSLTPRLLDEYQLLGKKLGNRKMDADWVEQFAGTLFAGTREQGAEAAAAALAEGIAPEEIGEAMSLAANMLVLHDPGRPEKWASEGKPKGSVHGASEGVHASDAANAWRNIARVTNHRNQVCSLIVGGWHTAGQMGRITDQPFAFDVDPIASGKPGPYDLLDTLKAAVESKDQAKAMAVVKYWETVGHRPKAIFDSLRKYAVSQDGALHAEKYFRTVTEEFATTRKELRWRHLIGLARVSTSEYGWPAPGGEQARDLLGA